MQVPRCCIALAVVAAGLVRCPAADADVTIRGTVEYWDEIDGRYKPARHIFVEVEGDWWFKTDPHVETDDKGRYSVTVRNPWVGDFNGVDIEAYAETEGLFQVYSSSFSIYPYHVISREFDDVKANSTLTIDLRFGKPHTATAAKQNLNVNDVPYRTMADTTKAFIIHQEMYEHRRKLRGMGWPKSAFSGIVFDTDVIVPAAGKPGTAYYNHFTGNINLVEAGWIGMGTWDPLPKTPDTTNLNVVYDYFLRRRRAVAYNDFRKRVRHEYSHAIHDYISFIHPWGLNIPGSHNPWMAAGRYQGYTEGFADFLALATISRTLADRSQPLHHLWEFSHSYPVAGTSNFRAAGAIVGLPVLAGDHAHMEGEITALLWDILDPKGFEVVRAPATRTENGGHPVPNFIIRRQVWYDNLHDWQAATIREAATEGLLGGGSPHVVQTVAQFIHCYRKLYSQSLHDLKAAAFNRGITDVLPVEHPATLTGTVSVRRRGPFVTIACTVREPDPEDRPAVRLTAYHQRSNGTIHEGTGLVHSALGGGWTGATRSVTARVALAPRFQAGETIWLEVNDDMLPRLYRFTVPAKDDAVVVAKMPDDKTAGPMATLPPGIGSKITAGTSRRLPTSGRVRHPSLPGAGGKGVGPGLRRGSFEDFEKQPLERWQFLGLASVKAQGGGRVLTTRGFSFGVWSPGPLDDFVAKLRYRHADGAGDLVLCLKGIQPPEQLYHLVLRNDALALTREADRRQQQLGTATHAFQPGRWYEIGIEKIGGRFHVAVAGKLVLVAEDRHPLPGGLFAFGSLLGSGFAFDDIAVAAAEPAAGPTIARPPGLVAPGPGPRPPAGWKFGEITNVRPGQPPRPPAGAPPAVVKGIRVARPDGAALGKEQAKTIRTLRQLIHQARAELRAHAERQERRLRHQRALYRLARERGGLRVASKARGVIRAPRVVRAAPQPKLAPVQAADLRSFSVWLNDRARGKPMARPLAVAEKAHLRDGIRTVNSLIQQQQAAVQQAGVLSRKLSDALAAIKFEPRDDTFRTRTAQAVGRLQQALRQIGADKTLVPALRVHRDAIDTLAR